MSPPPRRYRSGVAPKLAPTLSYPHDALSTSTECRNALERRGNQHLSLKSMLPVTRCVIIGQVQQSRFRVRQSRFRVWHRSTAFFRGRASSSICALGSTRRSTFTMESTANARAVSASISTRRRGSGALIGAVATSSSVPDAERLRAYRRQRTALRERRCPIRIRRVRPRPFE